MILDSHEFIYFPTKMSGFDLVVDWFRGGHILVGTSQSRLYLILMSMRLVWT